MLKRFRAVTQQTKLRLMLLAVAVMHKYIISLG